MATHRVSETVVLPARIDAHRVDPRAAQMALGQAVQARAGEVAAAVVADWSRRAAALRMSHQDAVDIVTRTCTLGTEIIARHLCTGEGVRPEEKRELVAGRAHLRRQVAILFLDLDGFKAVNDYLGHEAGDCLLKAVPTCLRGLVRPADTVARLGGDEFVVLCEDLPGGAAGMGNLVQRIRAGVANCSPPDGLAISVSVGVALAAAGADPAQVLARADAAMYAAKRGDHGTAAQRHTQIFDTRTFSVGNAT